MTQRIASGVEGLDSLLQGGIPNQTIILVTGPPGSGKSTLGTELAGNVLKREGGVVYAATGDTPNGIRNKLRIEGYQYLDPKALKIIDCFSWRSGRPGENGIRSLTDLNGLSMKVKEALAALENKKEVLLVIDSLSDFLMYSEKNSVYKTLQIISAEVKRRPRGFGVVVLEEGMHSPDVTNTVSYIVDGVIQMKTDGTKRLMRIIKMVGTNHPLNWIEYKIKGGTEIICVREFFK